MKTARAGNRSAPPAELASAQSASTVPDHCGLGQVGLACMLGVEGELCLSVSHLYTLFLAQCIMTI